MCFWKGLEALSSLILRVQSFLHPTLLAQMTRNTIICFELFWSLLLVKSMAKCKFAAHLSDPKRTPLPLSFEMLGLQRPWIKRQSAQTAVPLATSGICERREGVCYRGRKCMDLGCFPTQPILPNKTLPTTQGPPGASRTSRDSASASFPTGQPCSFVFGIKMALMSDLCSTKMLAMVRQLLSNTSMQNRCVTGGVSPGFFILKYWNEKSSRYYNQLIL